MLVLTRKVEQEIKIGENIVIKVIAVRGNSVRIGIQAPATVKILRRELVTPPGPMVTEATEGSKQGSVVEGMSRREDTADEPAGLSKPQPIAMGRPNRIGGPLTIKTPQPPNTLRLLLARQRRSLGNAKPCVHGAMSDR